jgi:sulfite exporter TauE/SafE
MCGPFAAIIGSHAESWKMNLLRQMIYSCGRIFTYSVLGSVAGAIGHRANNLAGQLPWLPALVAALAGLLLIKEGLRTAGILRRHSGGSARSGCAGGSIIKTLLMTPSYLGNFLAGLFTGLLPCGLVYAFLAIAVQSSSLVAGLITMLVFGAATVPVMVATGCSVSVIPHSHRHRLARLAGWCLVLAGIISLARGWGYLPWNPSVAPGCPFCADSGPGT